MAKSINARIVQKQDSLENWKKATRFIPEKGEFFLVNDYELPLVIGDGVTSAASLCDAPLMSVISNDEIENLFQN